MDTPSLLSELATGQQAIIRDFSDDEMAAHLLEIGFIPGEPVCIDHRAIAGDPMIVSVGGGQVSLRKSEAQAVLITLSDQ